MNKPAPQLNADSLPSLAQIAPHCLERAAKLQRALLRVLNSLSNKSLSASERERMGIADYHHEFGHAVTGRAIRALVKRAVDRDAGAENWSRLALYLPDNPPRKNAPRPMISLAIEAEYHELHEIISSFTNPASPNAEEKSYLWLRSFELCEQKTAAGKAPRKVRQALVKFLERNAPALCASHSGSVANALRVNFQRKYQSWLQAGRSVTALKDSRKEKSGRWRGLDLSEDDRDKLIHHATFNCGGRVAQAWRELCEHGKLSEAVTSYYLSNPRRKSYVPHRILESVKYEVSMMEDIHHGARQDKLNGAHISRDWSGVNSMDWFQADDFTMPVYFYAPDGRGWFDLMRGQVLLMIDLRSTCILGYVLLSQRNYNARAIRTLITKTCDEHGLPRKGFYFERGIWETSKLLKGNSDPCPLSWPETETGLREFGLIFKHANLPRSKPVERVGGAIQNLMEGLPGYIGRNEMVEKFERVQRLKLDVERRKTNPEGFFLSEDQYCDKLQEIFAVYNATIQNGKMTGGLSPDEAFHQFRNLADLPVKFSPECRYLLAHHKRPVSVTANGITLHFGKQTYNYRSVETSALRGQTVLAWFNPETPEILTVTDKNRKNPFCVMRSQEVPAMDAPPALLVQEIDRIEQHQSYAKARYRVLKARRAPQFRTMIADRETVELGATMNEKRAEAQTIERQQRRQHARAARASSALGLSVPARRDAVDAAENLNEFLSDDDSASSGDSTKGGL